ncbi:unnamed protein product [Orchesella dallaii]|uniref:Ricin B lectin domain-containing protein n=1 Tax=Orchesella dallaii TaxID=48710 RepID=A0ABP1QNU1_9HEXA
MKSIVIFLGLVQLVFGQRIFPFPAFMTNPGACSFNGPQDAPTLRGENFIENYGTNNCLSLKKYAPNRNPIVLQSCSWQKFPTSDQLFFFRNGNGGTILKPTRGPSAIDSCVAPSFGQQISAVQCSPKNSDQTWKFTRIRTNLYQIRQISSGRCLKAESRFDGGNANLQACNVLDTMQLWRVCTSK